MDEGFGPAVDLVARAVYLKKTHQIVLPLLMLLGKKMIELLHYITILTISGILAL